MDMHGGQRRWGGKRLTEREVSTQHRSTHYVLVQSTTLPHPLNSLHTAAYNFSLLFIADYTVYLLPQQTYRTPHSTLAKVYFV